MVGIWERIVSYELCDCGDGYYDPLQYSACYECFVERRSEYMECIYCGQWHSPKFNTCFKCRSTHPGRDEAGRGLRLEILLRDNFACRYCRATEGLMQVDHVKPCARGGTADPWNLQVLCADCNRWKGSTWYTGSRHDEARIHLMRLYFVFGWSTLTDEQRDQLNEQSDEYGSLFDRHLRRKIYLRAANQSGGA